MDQARFLTQLQIVLNREYPGFLGEEYAALARG